MSEPSIPSGDVLNETKSNKLVATASHFKDRAPWFKSRVPALFLSRQVKYEDFFTSADNLRGYVNGEGIHPTKTLALNWLAKDDLLPQGFRLLDVGCGPGVLPNLISKHPSLSQRIAYTGSDQSEEALSNCRKSCPSNFTFLRCDLQTEKLPDLFDVIVINDVIEHLPNYREVISAAISTGPSVFILTTFGVVPGLKRDRRLWNKKGKCYMNSYNFSSLYEFLRSKTNDLRLADLGTQEFERFWFPKKSLLLFYLRLSEEKILWSGSSWTNESELSSGSCQQSLKRAVGQYLNKLQARKSFGDSPSLAGKEICK
jgi:SAM-dependent methyltransferase